MFWKITKIDQNVLKNYQKFFLSLWALDTKIFSEKHLIFLIEDFTKNVSKIISHIDR
jgi:hypothetical protein